MEATTAGEGPQTDAPHRLCKHALAAQFQRWYSGESDVRVFTQSDRKNRPEFGCNELLYDITVARTAMVPAPRHKKDLRYISEVLWQIESEFKRDGREALFDFNKLVLGAAQYKLFIGPDTHDPDGILRSLLAPAKACTGRVYAAMVAHPDRWDKPFMSARLWEFSELQQQWHEHMPQTNAESNRVSPVTRRIGGWKPGAAPRRDDG